ncbi:hypothetical protein Q7P36_008839 [Cladosporium allicinum]
MTKLVDPVSSYMSESEYSRNFAFGFDINFWIPITEVCWSSKSLPSCPMHRLTKIPGLRPQGLHPAGAIAAKNAAFRKLAAHKIDKK